MSRSVSWCVGKHLRRRYARGMMQKYEAELLTMVQTAQLSGLSHSLISKLCRAGQLPSVKVGRPRRIPRNVVVQLLNEGLPPRGANHG